MSTDEEVTNSDTEPSTTPKKIDWDDIPADKQHELVSLAEKLGSDDPEKEAEETAEGSGVSRRTFLGAGATVGAGLIGTLVGGARADSNQAGTYGTAANPGDFHGEDMFMAQQSSITTPGSGEVTFGFEGTIPKYRTPDGTKYSFGEKSVSPGTTNLTALVDDGTHTDIIDAFISEYANTGSEHVYYIEPGRTYTVTSEYTFTGKNAAVVCPGDAQKWHRSYGEYNAPCRIEYNGSGNMLTVGDGIDRARGLRFQGIHFSPSSSGGAGTAINFGGDAEASVTRDIVFDRCAFTHWGGAPVSTASDQVNYDHAYHECLISSNGGTMPSGEQCLLDNCNVFRGGSQPTQLTLNGKSAAWNMTLSTSATDATAVVNLEEGTSIHTKNAEGNANSTIALSVSHTSNRPVTIMGSYSSWDVVASVSTGSVHWFGKRANIGSLVLDMNGGNASHNGSVILGLGPTEVSYSSDLQQVAHLAPGKVDNIASGDVPPGFIGMDINRGGTGTDSLILGPTTGTTAGPWYIDTSGTL